MRGIEDWDFQIAYRAAVDAITCDRDLSFRLTGSSDRLSMLGYLTACETLYVEALGMLRERGTAWPALVLDAGGSFGALAGALRSLGVAVLDNPADDRRVDLVIGLALHEQTTAAATIAAGGQRLLRPDGQLVVVVPCSQHRRRLAELRGRRAPAPNDGAVALGEPAYSRRRLCALLRQSGLRPDRLRARDYVPSAMGGPLQQTLSGAALRVALRSRHAWLALASPAGGA